MNWIGTIVRFIVSALVLMFVGFIVPGFAVMGFWSALLAAVVIALLGWAIEALFGRRISPFGRGIVGFISGAVVIYVAQLFVPGMRASILGALLASLVIGIVDLFIPTEMRGRHD
ncbi:MAG: phage holin family protein [Alicyclobacillus sp.]|nr:phage holin family protein [Alicyclobacillus sp.]